MGQPVGGGRALAIFASLAGRRQLGHLQRFPGFAGVIRPVFAMPFGIYLLLWALLGVLAAIVYWRMTRK